jgi:peptidoglycan/xylan/chitin deacetylase (PgdA/CDA1 family)
MTRRITQLAKRGLMTVGHYRRAFAQSSFPGVAVLCYHGVRDDTLPPGLIPFQYLHIAASTFDSHCRLLAECCDPISLDDWRSAIAGRATLPKRPVLVTFDDGYRSVLTKGVPVLHRHGIPAAVFVCTGPMRTRTPLWFDAVAQRDGECAVEAWKSRSYDDWREGCVSSSTLPEDDPRALMTPGELAALASARGIEIGGHTVNHAILARAPASVQRDEIDANLQAIRQWTGRTPRAFAYPNGRPGIDYTGETMRVLEDCGIDIAFSTRSAFSRSEEPALERSRFLMLDETSDAELAHRLRYSWPR